MHAALMGHNWATSKLSWMSQKARSLIGSGHGYLGSGEEKADPAAVASGGEGATRFVAGRRWEAGEERGGRASEGRAEPSRPLPLPGPSPAAAAGGRASGVRPQAVRARRL